MSVYKQNISLYKFLTVSIHSTKCVYIHIYIYLSVYKQKNIYMFLTVSIHSKKYVYIQTYIYICLCTNINKSIYTYVSDCFYTL